MVPCVVKACLLNSKYCVNIKIPFSKNDGTKIPPIPNGFGGHARQGTEKPLTRRGGEENEIFGFAYREEAGEMVGVTSSDFDAGCTNTIGLLFTLSRYSVVE